MGSWTREMRFFHLVVDVAGLSYLLSAALLLPAVLLAWCCGRGPERLSRAGIPYWARLLGWGAVVVLLAAIGQAAL
jgi:hypothetical protein